MKRLVSILICAIIGGAGFAQTDLQPAAIVRLTKSEPITVKQLRTEVELMEKQAGRTLTVPDRRQILDVMINERLAIQAAERDKITVSEAEMNQQIQQLKAILQQQLGRPPTDSEFAGAVRNETGLEVPAFREQLRRQMIVQKYLQFKKGNVLSSFKNPTEADIVSAYNLAKSQFVRPESVRFSMIQVPFGTDRTKSRALANRLIQDIGSNPAKFDEAVVKGQAPNAGYQAGDGGYLPRNAQAQQIVGAEFMTIAFALKQGEVSKLIEGVSGFQIIKVTETHAQQNLGLDDIFQLGSRMTVRDYIGNMLFQQQQQEVLKKASDELITELRRGNTFQIMEQNLNW
ncbi:MAG: peptidyl-prolyl cis-trans isomerase [Spirochaetaceae bacterium]|jgi:parvulin-like peptidyl-prolyl isomerase|nr:peptidyl-prolyl cis-trans isomerase [Spirochaetaceae bacterium]